MVMCIAVSSASRCAIFEGGVSDIAIHRRCSIARNSLSRNLLTSANGWTSGRALAGAGRVWIKDRERRLSGDSLGGLSRSVGNHVGMRRASWLDNTKWELSALSQGRSQGFITGNDDYDEAEEESQYISIPLLGEIPVRLPDLTQLTPFSWLKLFTLTTLALFAAKAVSDATIFNPSFLMYASWILILWPWPTAIAIAVATLITAFRASKRQPNEREQLTLLLGSLVWLILVPLASKHGFVDGWPLLLFAVYVGFFLISAVVRYRMYGDLSSKSEDKQWETTPSRIWQLGFIAGVVSGHLLAAFESPFLHFIWNFDWRTKLAAAVLTSAVFFNYFATYYLGKYFDRLVKPVALVMFGPYRWVRHPIYGSYMLLFMGYCLALRSYKSLVFILTACIVYYEHRTKLEEELLVDTFGELYISYSSRVQNKYFPLLY